MNDQLKALGENPNGMATYEYIVNHVDTCAEEMPALIDLLRVADTNGQFLTSTTRFLAAVDRKRFEVWFTPLIEAAIERDKERRYIGSLLDVLWGPNYKEEAEQLLATDDNFRRIYKRIYPTTMDKQPVKNIPLTI